MAQERSSKRGDGPGIAGGRGASNPVGPLSLAAIVAFGAGLGTVAWLAGSDAGATANPTRLEAFAAEIRAEGDAASARADAWMDEAGRALTSPISVTVPFRESGRFPPDLLAAAGYRFLLREGQVLEATIGAEPGVRYFVELFRLADSRIENDASSEVEGGAGRDVGDGAPAFVAEADSAGGRLRHEIRSDGEYLLRVVPEPFRGGRYDLDVRARASFAFPVAERGPESVISRYGEPRDEGERDHEGVDIYAPRGTPVVAVIRAMVSEVGASGRGGNYVWLQDWTREKEVYYAHLESHWVTVGTVVEPGDPIGAVGNTGNAEFTVPHLHFGIYDLDGRPADPLPYIAPLDAYRIAASETAP